MNEKVAQRAAKYAITDSQHEEVQRAIAAKAKAKAAAVAVEVAAVVVKTEEVDLRPGTKAYEAHWKIKEVSRGPISWYVSRGFNLKLDKFPTAHNQRYGEGDPNIMRELLREPSSLCVLAGGLRDGMSQKGYRTSPS